MPLPVAVILVVIAVAVGLPTLYCLFVRRMFRYRWRCPSCHRRDVCLLAGRPAKRIATFVCLSCHTGLEAHISGAGLIFDGLGLSSKIQPDDFEILPPDPEFERMYFG